LSATDGGDAPADVTLPCHGGAGSFTGEEPAAIDCELCHAAAVPAGTSNIAADGPGAWLVPLPDRTPGDATARALERPPRAG
jgi:hypothetical protein